MRIKSIALALVLVAALAAGCTKPAVPPATQSPAPATPAASPAQGTTASPAPTGSPDVVTTASIVDNNAAFEKAISKNGTWIIAITKDLTFDKPLVLEGDYKNGKKDANGKDITQRKVALYAQDANRTITARYTLTAPKLTVTSAEASIQHGTFKGDLYVAVNNFKLIDAVVDGNVFFTSDEFKKSFNMDDKSKVTGKQEVAK